MQKAFLRSPDDGIVRTQMAEQKRRGRIVIFAVGESPLRRLVGVAVFTAVQTGIIGADVPAFDAVAALPHAPVRKLFEGDPVGLSQDVQGAAAGSVDAITRIIPVGAAGLDENAVFFSDASQSAGQLVFVPAGQGNQFRQVGLQFFIHLYEAENTAVDVRREHGSHPLKGFQMPLYGIGFGQKNRIIALGHPFFPYLCGEPDQGLHAVFDGRDTRLQIPSVCGDRIVKIGGKAVGDLRKPRQDGPVILMINRYISFLLPG